MTFNATLLPSKHQFTVKSTETILEAALAQGYTLPYSCRNGACGVCKGKIIEGKVDYGNFQAYSLSAAEQAAGLALFCCAKPQSDLLIEALEVSTEQEIQVKTLPTRVQKMEKVAEDVMVIYLKLPTNERLQFFAGQYIDILQKEGKPRSFSLANAPHDDEFLQLHVRNIAGGTFTQHVFNEMKPRDILRIKGPLGRFCLQENSDKPIVFIASGTGFAPIKAIIEHALHIGIQRKMYFYWGVRKQVDLYMIEKARQWEAAGIQFVPVVSDEVWQGRTGFVHQAVVDDFADLSGYQVYACGAPVVVEAAHRDLTEKCALPSDAFFSDAFTFAPKK